MKIFRAMGGVLLILWSLDATAVLWRLGAVSTDSLKVFATTGDTQKTISIDVAGIGVFSKQESIWTDTSDGSPENTYYAVLEITGLMPWTDYSYQIFEDGIAKGSGQFRTLPLDQSIPFELALTGCNISRSDGLKNEIVNRSYAKGGELLAIVHVDDIGYIDASNSKVSIEGVQITGVPRETKLSYDYAASWIIDVFNDTNDGQLWINHNLPTFWMWGDHEVVNDFLNHKEAIASFSAGTRVSGEHTTLDNRAWLAANKAYSKVASASPVAFDDITSIDGINGRTYAYGFDIGPIRFFLQDRNSAGECYDCTPDVECVGKICGEISGHQPYRENFGKTQLDHMKTWLDDGTHPFKILFSGITVGGHSVIDNQPWLSWWPSEYYDFEAWLDNSVNLNGTTGNFIYVAGDRHNFSVHKRSKDSPNNGGANFMEYYVGTINGTSNHAASPIGEIMNGCEVLYSETGGKGVFDHWLTVMGVNKSSLRFKTYDKNYDLIFQGTLTHAQGNHFTEMKPALNIIDAASSVPSVLVETRIRGNNIDVYSDVAYLSTGWNGFNVVDIIDPLSPSLLDTVSDNYANNVTVNGSYLYVSSGWRGLDIYDISNPLLPVYTGSGVSVAGGYVLDIAIDVNDRAFLAAKGSASLQIFDVSNKQQPKIRGWLDLGEVNAVDVTDKYLLIANGSEGLAVLTDVLPVISVTPANFDFASITIGSTSVLQSFSISNTGAVDLVISSADMLGDAAEFLIVPGTCGNLPLTIAAGLSCDIGIHFSTAILGGKSANLRLASNDTVTPSLDIILTGTGQGVVPLPDIKANGQDATLNLPQGTPVSIDITLTAGDLTGRSADIFVSIQTTANGNYWLMANGSWEAAAVPTAATATGLLSDIPVTTILNASVLPWSDSYNFVITVDTVGNNVYDDISYTDTVTVNIQ